jgi:hypothetical protein
MWEDAITRGINLFALDLDEPTELQKLVTFFNLRYAFPGKQIVIELSAGRRGLHYKVPKATLSPEQDMELREFLGDCRGRLWFSRQRYAQAGDHNILFDFKKIPGKGIVFNLRQDKKNLLHLPFKLLGNGFF